MPGDLIKREVVELDAGATKARMLVDHRDVAALERGELYVAVFNTKGRPHPVQGHHKDWQDWEKEGARRLQLMRDELAFLEHRTLPPGPHEFDDIDVDAAMYDAPSRTSERIDWLRQMIAGAEAKLAADSLPRGRIAIARAERKAADVFRFSITVDDHNFVTHIAVGARQADGSIKIIGGAELSEPIAVLAFHEFRMGVRFTTGLLPAAGEHLLPAAAFQKAIEP
jgi:hypothetical protein